MGEHPDDAIGLEIERPGAVGNDRKFVSVGLDRDPVQPLLEQVRARRRVKREHLLAHRRGQLRVHVVEREDDVDRLGVEARGDRIEAGEVEAEEAAGKREIIAQEVEPAKELVVVGDQRLAFAESDLLDHVGAARRDNGIAEGVEHAEIDAGAMGEQLLIERDRVCFLAEQMEAQRLNPVG